MNVPFLDLRAQYQTIKSEIDKAVLDVLGSGTYVLGPEVSAFETEFAQLHSAKHGIAVNSGTSALHLALLVAGVGPGDEVITVSMTFVATAAAIRYAGATPVLVDVDDESYTIDVTQIEAAITPRTKAIVPVHLYGQAADMDPIMEIARRRNLVVIEDAAQAHCAEYKGRRVGSIGHIAAFSFYPGKNLGAYGEGGIVLTNDPKAAHMMRLLRDWGQEKKYHHELHAFNYRMDAIQGAILRVKLRHLDAWTEARRAHAKAYDALLGRDGVDHVREVRDRRHVYHIYSVFDPNRLEIQQKLLSAGIQTGIHYPIPVHLQPAYGGVSRVSGELPVTERVAQRQLSLPMFPELTDAQAEYVANQVAALTTKKRAHHTADLVVSGSANASR